MPNGNDATRISSRRIKYNYLFYSFLHHLNDKAQSSTRRESPSQVHVSKNLIGLVFGGLFDVGEEEDFGGRDVLETPGWEKKKFFFRTSEKIKCPARAVRIFI
jgi:hypothetical protein